MCFFLWFFLVFRRSEAEGASYLTGTATVSFLRAESMTGLGVGFPLQGETRLFFENYLDISN